ncbi:MAG TPA: DUF1822 family protein [Oculatellaceae cyanobacterium]|jgi:hypothetical protein
MSNSIDINQKITLTFPITETQRQTALKFAQQQYSKQKQSQVYLNTLAVLVTRNYLQILDIATDIEKSYCWNAIERFSLDVADLKITDPYVKTGHLECRPVKTGDRVAEVPAEVWEDRIGYIFVQFDAECQEGTLLGFLPEVCSEQIPLAQLQSLESFLEFLYQPAINWLRLSDWFDNIFATGWQTLEEVINSHVANPKLAFRLGKVRWDKMRWLQQQLSNFKARSNLNSSAILAANGDPIPALVQIIETTDNKETLWKAAEMLWEIEPTHPAAGARRIIDLGMQLGGNSIALMVAVLQKLDDTMEVLLRVYPLGTNEFLPPGLKLIVSDFDNLDKTAEVQSRFQPLDTYIQLKLGAELGKKFTVKVLLDEASFIEYFMI